MTQPTCEADALRARNILARTVRSRLKGRGLDIRELSNHLVISDPGHPDHGRVYISYANGDASLRRCTWDYLGRLDGYGSTDPDTEARVTADTIISTLTGRAGTPS